jgi:DNA polymerase-3 subunit beta
METAKEEAICHIHGRGSEYHIAGQDVEDFPGVPPMPEGEVLEIEAQIFGEMIQKTRFAAASEAMRYALNGILIAGKKGDKTIEMVGADGRRLAHIKRKANTPCPVDLRAIVSLKCASHMERLLSESEGAIKLRFGERQVWLAGGAVTLMGLLVEGHYPNYEEVIPDDCDKRAVLDLGALVSAVRRAAVVTTDESRGVTFSFAPKQLVVCSQSAERGSAKVEIEAEYDGPAAEIRFNSDYVLDMLKVADEERIQFEFKEAARPAILRAGRNYQYVVMPITEGSV